MCSGKIFIKILLGLPSAGVLWPPKPHLARRALQARDQVLQTRTVHLPLAFNEKWTNEAIAKYMRSSRSDAPYLPSNVDFVAANNGARP